MLKILGKDLHERVTVMRYGRSNDALGGWQEHWTATQERWALVEPIRGRDGYHPHDVGGGMAAGLGYQKNVAPARYRVIVRAPLALDNKDRMEWHVGESRMVMELASAPYYIQRQTFVGMLMTEVKESEHG